MRAARRNLYAKERPCGAGPSVRALDWLTLRLSPQTHGVGEPSKIRDLLGVRCPWPVPSRLVGCRVKVHIYDDRLVCYLGTTPVLSVARRYFKRNGPPQRVVDYRHLIGPLIRKPQAFRHSVFREELFPSSVFRRAWKVLDERLEPRKACRVYVGLLHLAAMQGREAALADHLAAVLDAGGTPDLEVARAAVVPPVLAGAPAVMVLAPDLAVYDELLRMPILGDAA